MKTRTILFSSLVMLAVAIWLTGCRQSSEDSKPTTTEGGTTNHDHADHEHANHDQAGHEHTTDGHPDHDHAAHGHDAATAADVAEALSALSPEDRALAEEQKICPVSDELLGSAGTPIKVDVNGREVFICCEDCKEDLQANPETYLAKLPR